MTTLTKQAAEIIHAQGGRMTLQRQVILDALENLGGHPTAEELYSLVQEVDQSINLSTIYRTLRWLESQGLVRPCWFEEDRRQQRFDPAEPGDHYHFRCMECNQIIEFSDARVEEIKQAFAAAHQAHIESATLILYGICADCRSRST